MSLSKIASSDMHGENSAYFDGLKAFDEDPFHPVDNPNGVIQMGLAENQVSIFMIHVSLINFTYSARTVLVYRQKLLAANFAFFLFCFPAVVQLDGRVDPQEPESFYMHA